MSKPTNNTFMNNESESDSDLVLVSTFPTFAQLEKNSYLKQIWEEWNSNDHQDISLYNEIQFILQEMKKSSTSKPAK